MRDNMEKVAQILAMMVTMMTLMKLMQMYNSDHDEINDVGEGDGEGGEVGGAGGEGRDTATGIRAVSGDDDPSSDQWWTTIENHRYQWLLPTVPFNGDGP